jgi:hypothetical protein
LNFDEHLRLTLFGLEGFTHSVGDGTLVQSLECLYRHFYFVSHTHQQKAPLGAVNCNLPNYLVEALRVQFFSDGADSCFPCLPLLQLFVELILQIDDIQAGCWTWWNVLHPQLPHVLVLSRRQNGVEIIVLLHFARDRGSACWSWSSSSTASLCPYCLADQHWSIIF